MKNEYVRMIVVLTIFAAVCGFLLATVRNITAPEIEKQILINIKAPALNDVLASSDNKFLNDKVEFELEGMKYRVFTGRKKGKAWAVAYEGKAMGFNGDVSIMLGLNIENDSIAGLRILTQQETPGLGARVAEPAFTKLFEGKKIAETFKVKKDGGNVDAVTGATNSSRAVCKAVENCKKIYPLIKKLILDQGK
jgi:electron transport complex protein RnfG